MAVFLLDTNVLISLIWPNHSHHQRAHAWFSTLGDDRWATCPMTECGFVRISSNPGFDLETLTPPEAIAILRQTISHPRHVFWEDTLAICSSSRFPLQSLTGHKQITDAYLFTMAIERGEKLVTFDAGIPSLARNDADRQAIVLLS